MFSPTLRQRGQKISLHSFKPVELNLLHRFLYMSRLTICRQLNVTYGFSWFNKNDSSAVKDMKYLSTKMNCTCLITPLTKF